MQNAKLTLETRLEVIDLYFGSELTIKEVATIIKSTKSVVGRVVKHHKEKYLNNRVDYLQYPKHYYKKYRDLLKLKREIGIILDREILLNELELSLNKLKNNLLKK